MWRPRDRVFPRRCIGWARRAPGAHDIPQRIVGREPSARLLSPPTRWRETHEFAIALYYDLLPSGNLIENRSGMRHELIKPDWFIHAFALNSPHRVRSLIEHLEQIEYLAPGASGAQAQPLSLIPPMIHDGQPIQKFAVGWSPRSTLQHLLPAPERRLHPQQRLRGGGRGRGARAQRRRRVGRIATSPPVSLPFREGTH